MSRFNKYVTQELLAYHVYTSPYYPQGNAINESSHKALNRSISAYLHQFGGKLEDALAAAVSVHNSCPHSATGVSPYYALFGMEPTFPGWQKYRQQDDAQLRQLQQQEHRNRALLKSVLQKEEYRLIPREKFKLGDWVVFFRSQYEKSVSTPEGASLKYSPLWSLPAKVIDVRPGVLLVQEWGTYGRPRQVPMAHVRLLTGPVPLSLQTLNMQLLEVDHPRVVRPKFVDLASSSPTATWNDFLTQKAQRVRKRPRQGNVDQQLVPNRPEPTTGEPATPGFKQEAK